MEKTDKVKLNIGSNDFRYPEFLNVDIRDIEGVDIVDDVRTLNKIKDGSVDHIIAEAILEHFSPDRTQKILDVWVRKLKPGGRIEVMVPDGELIFDRYMGKKSGDQLKAWKEMLHPFFGNIELMREWHGEDMELYMHHTLFCKSMLEEHMRNCGLVEIQEKKARHPDCLTLTGKKKDDQA